MISCGASLATTAFNNLATASGCNFFVGLDMDTAIRTHSQSRADRFLALRNTERYGDHFRGLAAFLQAQRFFDCDFVEGIHGKLHVGRIDPRSICLNPDFHVEIDDAFDRYKNLHALSCDAPHPHGGP